MYVLFIVDALERFRIETEESLRNVGNEVEFSCLLQKKKPTSYSSTVYDFNMSNKMNADAVATIFVKKT